MDKAVFGLIGAGGIAQCVLSGHTPENASADDGYRASLLSHAAIRSRDTGEVVSMGDA